MSKKTEPWKMNEKDVIEGVVGSSGGSHRGGRMARTSRKGSMSSSTLTLVHGPTEIRVSGTVPEGHYSHSEMTAERKHLREELWKQLEDAVAKSMRLPGR